MFCSKCGKQLPDNAAFCDGCGTSTGVAPGGAVTPTVQVDFAGGINEYLGIIKGFFSKKSVETIKEAANNTSVAWLYGFLANALIYAIVFALNMGEFFKSSEMFGEFFLNGFLISVLTYFLLSGLLFVCVKFVMHKESTYTKMLNFTMAASLPLTVIYVVNLTAGFIWFPLVLFLSMVGILASSVLFYGVIRDTEYETKSFYTYVLVWVVFIFVLYLFIELTGEGFGETIVRGMMGGLM